jgi:hypothetical protein
MLFKLDSCAFNFEGLELAARVKFTAEHVQTEL